MTDVVAVGKRHQLTFADQRNPRHKLLVNLVDHDRLIRIRPGLSPRYQNDRISNRITLLIDYLNLKCCCLGNVGNQDQYQPKRYQTRT